MRLLGQIERFARCDATVLINGETGTGKELTARAIHYHGKRAEGPFIPINCGALPDALFGSELFGHTRGAFTDAYESRAGLVEQAEGGTLFLDELEALSPAGQVALLRFLQDHEYRPLGAPRARVANVRVLGATNADLSSFVRQGKFRQDLLYRLDVLTLDVPPLRNRGDDALVLARAFLRKLCSRYQQLERTFHADAIAALRSYEWPGNVRELENLIRRIAALHPEETVLPEIIDRELVATTSPANGAEPGDDTGGLSGYLENHLARQFASFNDGLRIDVVLAKMRKTAVENAADAADDLEIVRHAGVVERKGHVRIPPKAVLVFKRQQPS